MSVPYVELRFNPTDLRPRDLPSAGAFLGSPADAMEAALAVARQAMVTQLKNEVRGLSEPTHSQLLRLADLAWQAVFWRYRKISAPVMADAYISSYRAANAGDVPMSVIYDLADKHAEKVGDYFHATSREALADGFNTLVNRRIPAKAAADRVLDAYGLTPRQMRTYVSATQFNTPISNAMPRSVKARARAYVDKAFTTRTRKLSRQEEHNIDEQAKQFAWMWLQDKGRLTEKAQKMWVTAKDERVCPVCGPLHGKKVGINDQFKTKEGAFWSPGLHPNCRCVVRLIENRFSKNAFGIIMKADWDAQEHPRGGDPENRGRFSRVAERESRPVIAVAEEDVIETSPPVADILPTTVADIRPGVLRRMADIAAPVDIAPVVADIVAAPVADIAPVQADILGLLPKATVAAPTVSDITVIQEPAKKTRMVPYEEIRPLDETYYKVVSGDPGFHQFDREVFSADRDQVVLDAAEVREAAIERIMDQHVVDGQVKYREMVASYGVPLEARIPEAEFRNILEVLGQHTTSEPPNDAIIDVDYYDPDGYDTDAPIETSGRTVMDIAHAVGVDPDHLAVHVVKLDAVHSENVGRGHAHRQQIVGHVYDEYEITGEYNVTDWAPEYEEGTGTTVGMDIYFIDPHSPAVGYMEDKGDLEEF